MASVETESTIGSSEDGASLGGKPSSPLGPLVALSAVLAIGAFLVLAPIVRGVLPGTELGGPFEDHHQDAETALFLLCFAVLLPLSAVLAPRIADRIASGPNRDGLSTLAASLSAGLAIVLILAKLSDGLDLGGGGAAVAVAAGLWWPLAGAALWRAASSRPWDRLLAASSAATSVWIAAAVLTLGVVLAFARLDSISPAVLLIGLILIPVVVVARERVSVPTPSRPLGVAADAAVIVLLLLAVPNVIVFVTGDASSVLQLSIIQFHQNFYLGPVNQVLAGDAVLIDTISQYGVGSIYFLAGAFKVLPIGNGTLGLVEGMLSAVMFIGAYAVLRIAGVARLLAGSAMAVAVAVLVYGLEYPLGALLQHGAFRFGLPIGVVVGAVAESRWPQAARPARTLQLLTVAIASIWALEAFAYTLFTLLAVVAVRTAAAPAGSRRQELVGWALGVVGACLAAHLLFASATLIATGELPDWGWYLNTLQAFLVGPVGELTYDFSPWSAGLALGGLYLISASALVQIVRRRPDLLTRERTMLIAIAGMTAFGVALFSYLMNRSTDRIVPYVGLPAVALVALWLTLLQRPGWAISIVARRAGLASTLAIATLLVAVAASSVGTRFSESALGHLRPGGASLTAALDRLADPPPLRPITIEGERLLDEYMPGERRSIVLMTPDPGLETLIRSGRASAVPLGDPYEDSLVPEDHLEPLGEFVETLAAGDRMLIDPPGRETFDLYRRDPSRDPLDGAAFAVPAGGVGLTTLQEWVMKQISMRFDLRRIAESQHELEVVELVPRRVS